MNETGEAAGLGCDCLQVLVVGGKHSVLHGLDRSKHRHKRRAQLVRNIRGNAALMLEVLLERGRHLVEGLAKAVDLVVALKAGACRKIAVTDLLRRAGNTTERVGEHARHEDADNHRDGHCDNRGEEHRIEGAVTKRRVRLAEQRVRTEHPQAHLPNHRAISKRDVAGNRSGRVGRGARDKAMGTWLATTLS